MTVDQLETVLLFVGAKVNDAIAALRRGDAGEAAEAMRDAEARLRVAVIDTEASE